MAVLAIAGLHGFGMYSVAICPKRMYDFPYMTFPVFIGKEPHISLLLVPGSLSGIILVPGGVALGVALVKPEDSVLFANPCKPADYSTLTVSCQQSLQFKRSVSERGVLDCLVIHSPKPCRVTFGREEEMAFHASLHASSKEGNPFGNRSLSIPSLNSSFQFLSQMMSVTSSLK